MNLGTSSRIIHTNGVDLAVETHGDPDRPAVLLIGGASTSMDMWPPPLCERLAEAGRYVIRYDFRDTGQSTTYGAGGATYTLLDLVGDAFGLLEALGVQHAHVVGMSMGGLVAQLMAATRPDDVSSVTLVSTTVALPDPDAEELPSMSADDLESFAAATPPDWSDAASVVDYLVAQEHSCAARTAPFDEEGARAAMALTVARSADPAASENHFSLGMPDVAGLSMADIVVPTLVLHGDEDPVFPLAHGEALAHAIPGARLERVIGVGHEVPARMWDQLVAAVLDHTAVRSAAS